MSNQTQSRALRVLVFDDNLERDWKQDVERALSGSGRACEVVAATQEEFAAEFEHLARAEQSHKLVGEDSLLNTADIVVVDSDINHPTEGEDNLSGRDGTHFVLLARHYSRVGTTVVVNAEHEVPTIDLRLNEFADSPADFHVNGESLAEPAFWWRSSRDQATPNNGKPMFAPASWVGVIDHFAAMETAMGLLASADSGEDLSALLGFNAIGGQWTPSQLDAFLGEANHVITLNEVLDRSLRDVSPRAALPQCEEHRLRVATHALSRLVRRVLTPPCNVLVDQWHLVIAAPKAFADCDTEQAVAVKLSKALGDGLLGDVPKTEGLLAALAVVPTWPAPKLLTDFEPVSTPKFVVVEESCAIVARDDAVTIRHALGGPVVSRYVARERGPIVTTPMNRLNAS